MQSYQTKDEFDLILLTKHDFIEEEEIYRSDVCFVNHRP